MALDMKGWPAAKVEIWALEDLLPYARNARTHPEEQIAQIAQSIEEFGWTIPVLAAPDGTIIAGHGRVLAATKLGISEVPVIVAHGWSDDQRRAYTLADNRLAETSEWDEEILRAELADLAAADVDLNMIGWTAEDLADLAAAPDAGSGPSYNEKAEARASLAERFGMIPFSVISDRDGRWQDRKRAWIALGIRSELGRGENLQGFSDFVLAVQNNKQAEHEAKKKGKAKAKTFHDGAVRGKGGFADQVAAAADKRR